MKWSYSNLSKIAFSMSAGLLLIMGLKEHTALLVAQTNSLPYRYFLLIKKAPAKKGDLIAIQHHPLFELPNVILTKRLVGLPGDKIILQGQVMNINQEWQGPLHRKNSQGHPLTPLSIRTIPEDFVFVAGSHSASLDSRYKEFGLVKRQHILGKVYALW
jgi:signal peptidase I